ncbi:MAG: isoaspartyl peptidase/L-asparaginase [Planctomycetes bacterium]|nr:isoaspartyl peptidase/L-asparaginase [Planctomycetota bacterium]
MTPALFALLLAAATLFPGCAFAPATPTPKTFALAIHGGAGTLSKNTPPERRKEYEDALAAALTYGRDRLALGDSALDVCESVVRILEDDPRFNAGKGAVYNEQGQHELDASIMDGSTLRCGAVAGVRTVRHPISLARLVMEKTRHVLLAGDGAEKFADGQNIERVSNDWFDTEQRRKQLDEALKERASKGAAASASAGATATTPDTPPADRRRDYGTVGCVALDAQGRLVAATSTGGMTAKRWGRIGDSPVIGAGNYADRFIAVSCTGTGEQFLRHVVGKSISARVELAGASLDDAVAALVDRTLQPGDGGVIAVDRFGNLVARFSSEGMYRGLADASGRFEVGIF